MTEQLELFDELFLVSPYKDIDQEVEKLFRYYRETGFPNYKKEDYSVTFELRKLMEFDESSIYDKEQKEIEQSMVGLGVLWTYHPHWIDVRCGDSKSLAELWNDDVALKKLLKKTYLWKIRHKEQYWTDNRIRQNAKVYLARQSVSNFRPSVAKLIYNTYGKNGKVFDMSCGWGGRLLGFLASECREYVGCEPSSKTFNGLQDMVADIKNGQNYRVSVSNKVVTLLNHGSEIYEPNFDDYFDLCFSSPPYFNTEKYSDEETQSWVKYPTYKDWVDGFLFDTIKNCSRYTKKGGYVIVNIADVRKYGLESDTIRIASENGLILVDTLHMVLSSIAGNGKKYEPIFIFRK